MKVLLYRLHVCQDGIASWMVTLARELRGLGVECGFWFPKVFYRPLEDFERLGPVHTAPIHKAAEVVRSGGYDLVHVVNFDHTAELLGLVRPRLRVVVTSHGDLSDAWSRRNCFAYTAVSADMTALNQPLTDLEVETVPNGVDGQRFRPPARVENGPPLVAWVGRSTDERKDFPRFTRIAARLAARGVRLWVADAHGASWKDFSSSECCPVPFERWERIPAAAMPEFYRDLAARSGALLMTSRHEGWPVAALEAGASGVPTIGPDVFGLRQAIIPEQTGMLYGADAADESVAECVWDWLQRGGHGAEFAACCAAAVRQRFSAETMARRYVEIYARPEQRLCDHPALPADRAATGFASLWERLRTHRWHRAAFLCEAARCLARDGQHRLAGRALRRSIRVAPRSAANPRRALHLLTTMGLLLRGLSSGGCSETATGPFTSTSSATASVSAVCTRLLPIGTTAELAHEATRRERFGDC